jgi:hypothetical protein
MIDLIMYWLNRFSHIVLDHVLIEIQSIKLNLDMQLFVYYSFYLQLDVVLFSTPIATCLDDA